MNYEFDLEKWLPRFPLEAIHETFSAEAITSPCHLCNNEFLRRGMTDQFDWGQAVPVDIFVLSRGEPENRYATKIGGLPYRPDDQRWPQSESGRSMTLIAQFNFTNSRDIVPDVTGDLLLVFGDEVDGQFEHFYFEWQNLAIDNPVTAAPSDCIRINPCYGNRFRTLSYPNAKWLGSFDKDPQCLGRDVWASFHILQFQATQIGHAPFFIQTSLEEHPDPTICTISSVQPHCHNPYPWVNHPEPLLPKGQWKFHDDDNLMIGDVGCIYVFMDSNGRVYAEVEDY